MDVLVSILGEVKVDHCLERVRGDIEAPSCHAGGNQDHAALRAEVLQYLGPLMLWFLPMQSAYLPCS